MEEVLYTFAPNNSATIQTIWAATIIALGALAGTIAMLRKKAAGRNHNQNMLAAMLLFFVMLISAGTAFFSWLKARKTGPVTITGQSIETPYGKAEFSDIKDAYIHTDSQPSLVDPNRSVRATKMLVIEERSGKTHVMSEEDYPVKEILAALKDTFSGWKEKSGK